MIEDYFACVYNPLNNTQLYILKLQYQIPLLQCRKLVILCFGLNLQLFAFSENMDSPINLTVANSRRIRCQRLFFTENFRNTHKKLQKYPQSPQISNGSTGYTSPVGEFCERVPKNTREVPKIFLLPGEILNRWNQRVSRTRNSWKKCSPNKLGQYTDCISIICETEERFAIMQFPKKTKRKN